MWTKGVSLPPTILMARFSWGSVRLILMQVISPSGIRWYNLGKPGNVHRKVFIWHLGFASLRHAPYNFKYLSVTQTRFYALMWYILRVEQRKCTFALVNLKGSFLMNIFKLPFYFFPPRTLDTIQTDEMSLRKKNTVMCANILREKNTFLATRDPSEPGHSSSQALQNMGIDKPANPGGLCCSGLLTFLTASIPDLACNSHGSIFFFTLSLQKGKSLWQSKANSSLPIRSSSLHHPWSLGSKNIWLLLQRICMKTSVHSERGISEVIW